MIGPFPPAARRRAAAGALIRDEHGRVLLVEPTYRSTWLLPGGVVEADESPRQGVAREIVEELGLPLPIGRLLVMQWEQPVGAEDGILKFAYDGGVVHEALIAAFQLPADELASFRFAGPEEVASLTTESTSTRVTAALHALASGTCIELDA